LFYFISLHVHWISEEVNSLTNKKAQLSLRNPRDATAFQIHPEEIRRNDDDDIYSIYRRVETNIQCVYYGYIQLEIRYLVSEFRIRITSTYSRPLVSTI